MASSMVLSGKTHLSGFKSNSDKDTLSEASESGTSNSVTSEDLQKLVVILGLNSVEEVYQERFRVDRRRLESMLAENLEESQRAQSFFNRVMTETNTLINWPARLKIGARSKKDPHVRVAGRCDDVKKAREKIMQLLDTRNNRVTMKIDVSYTDHSHIIGKGGLTIKRVMEETGCHIHFPDSNRTSTVEKSNQVSIAGDMERVERARARVRALTPLVFCFELPITSPTEPLPDIDSPYVVQIQDKYNVQVAIRNRAKLHALLFVVKGVQWEVQATMEATTLLMSYMCGHLVSQTKVLTFLEISPMHHAVVVGKGAEQLKIIMKGTNTQIMFPDADDPNIPNIRKNCVTISGQIKDVYAARQQLVGCLPVLLIFDVMDNTFNLESDTIGKVMHKHNVLISVRKKPKQGFSSVVIKGIERCAENVYDSRRELLGGTEPQVAAEIPESYSIPSLASNFLNYGVFNSYSPQLSVAHSPCSPYNLAIPDMNYVYGSPMFHSASPGYLGQLSPATLTSPGCNAWVIPSPQPRSGQFLFPPMGVPNHGPAYKNPGGSWNTVENEMHPPMMVQHSYQTVHPDGRTTLSHILNSSSQASSGYQSNFTGSSVSLDAQNISGGEGNNMVSPSVSPISKALSHSPAPSTDVDRSQNELASIISEVPLANRLAVGCEKKTLETLKMSPLSEYKKLKADAANAMQEKVGSGCRVPNPRWSGYYFSHTSPGPMKLNDMQAMTTPEKGWNKSDLVRPNIAESVPSPNKPCRYQQLYDLLKDMGLQKYIDLFKQHELDMSTFASLNEADLIEIGVTAFGARRKMLLTITELQKQSSAYKGNVAGGERKLVNSPPYNTAALNQDKW